MKRVLSFFTGLICLAGTLHAGTYVDRLDPVVHLRLDADPTSAEVMLKNGRVLKKSTQFPGSYATAVEGPATWTGKGWDFSQCEGTYQLLVGEAMSRVGNITDTAGFTVSFWVKGEYSGSTMRIMTGPFDIGTGKNNIYGGSHDYQTAKSSSKIPIWDNVWHHIAVVVDFRKTLNNVNLYIDGTVAGSRSASYLKNLASAVGRTWTFGGRHEKDPGFNYGALADISIYGRPLELNEVVYLSTGPVFAGADQTVELPNLGLLDGFAPSGAIAVWRKEEGAASVQIKFKSKEKTQVRFSEAGTYRFSLEAGNFRDEVEVKVLPNQPPEVSTGSGTLLSSGRDGYLLRGSVKDASIVPGKTLQSRWTVVEAPEGAKHVFKDDSSPETMVYMNQPGLYTFRLEGRDGELSTHADVNVLVGAEKKSSYLTLLNPLFLLDFEQPPRCGLDASDDALGRTGIKIRSENGTPTMLKGARPFTGYAWDFSASDADVEVINGIHLLPMHDKRHPVRSLSCWIKGDEKTKGYASSALGLLAASHSHGLNYSANRLPSIGRSGVSVFDGQWHHVVVVLETIDGRVKRKIIVDGTLIDEADDALPTPFWEPSSRAIRHPWYIGSRGRSGADSFSGQLDDVAIFDYALSAADIAFIMNGPSAAEQALLDGLKDLNVEAGENAYVQLPASYALELKGSCPTVPGLTPRWSKKYGKGEVVLDAPDAASTRAVFHPVETDKDGPYSKFIMRLSLVNDRGREVVGDDVAVLFYPKRAPNRRAVTATPAPGVHPRVLFTAEDLPELRKKAVEVPVAARAMEAMAKRAKTIDMPADHHGSLCQALLRGDAVSLKPYYKGNTEGFFNLLQESAYVAWLGTGGVSDEAQLVKLGNIFSAGCSEMLTWYKPNHGNALCHDVSWSIGLAYDLLYNQLDEAGREDARALLARMTRYRQTVGADTEPRQTSSNWAGLHDHLIMALLAIEGEPGYDENALDVAEFKKAIFLSQYGIFSSGLPHEGYAYFGLGMHWHAYTDYAISRRAGRENLQETTRFYSVIEAAFRLLDPDGSGIRSHHDVVGDPDTTAGLAATPPRQVYLAKYLWSEDRMIDYVYGTLVKHQIDEQDRYLDMFHAVFGEKVRYPEQSLQEAAGRRDPVKYCPDRGVMLVRDSWDDQGMRLDFRCRQDKYNLGHQHSDVNTFELWSHQRAWIIDPGKFSSTANDVGSTILIDGISACSSKRYTWPSCPGRFVSFSNTDKAVTGVGDAKTFFDYSFGKPRSGEAVLVKDHGLMWADFYTPRTGEEMPEWMAETPLDLDGYGNPRGLWVMNPMQQATRSVSLLKGKFPAVLVSDDYVKDDQEHDYTWIASTVPSGEVVKVSGDQSTLVLRHKDDVDAGPRLLIKVLNADGQTGPIDLHERTLQVDKDPIKLVRIEIPCRSADPGYRVLFYPYVEGEDLSEKNWDKWAKEFDAHLID